MISGQATTTAQATWTVRPPPQVTLGQVVQLARSWLTA
jgi:hypothetical protein